jgi:4-carboxymuconolactone decarboxylase
MARLAVLSSADLSSEQTALLASLQSAGRATVTGPYSVLVRVPEIGAIIRDLSFRLRTRTRLADRLFEVMVLTVARSWSAQYEWFAHEPGARAAGVPEAAIDALRAGRPDPPFATEDERVVFALTDELLRTKRVSDATYGQALTLLGEELLIELVAAIGFYNLISVVLNAFEVPTPEGRPSPLPERY